MPSSQLCPLRIGSSRSAEHHKYDLRDKKYEGRIQECEHAGNDNGIVVLRLDNPWIKIVPDKGPPKARDNQRQTCEFRVCRIKRTFVPGINSRHCPEAEIQA